MRFALVNGQRREAEPGLVGVCRGCRNPMIPKCGEVRIRHWAHRGRRCDVWSENKTEWHRGWQDEFPAEWQEIGHRADDGEWHYADVKTERGWVLEFQHSLIKPEERRSREAFYEKLIWVVNGTRRKRDEARFRKELQHARRFGPRGGRRLYAGEGRLLQEWGASTAHVLFDFGDDELWWLSPKSDRRWAYVLPLRRDGLLWLHQATGQADVPRFEQLESDFSADIVAENAPRRVRVRVPRPRPGRHFRF